MDLSKIGKEIKGHYKFAGGKCNYALIDILDIYEPYFKPYRNQPITFLEIGIGQGGSLSIWKRYFPNAQIWGIDIKDKTQFQENRVNVLMGDQKDPIFINELIARAKGFDIIIDDGGHTQEDQIETLKLLWNHVGPNGLYIIEDMCTAYWSAFGGGYNKPSTIISVLKDLIDNVNYVHAASEVPWTYQEYLKAKETVKRTSPAKEEIPNINGTLDSIHFHETIAILKKK